MPTRASTNLIDRSYALQRNRPLTLQATINLPTPADDPTDPCAHHLNNFFSLVNLFRPFDDAFVAMWNKTRNNWPSSHLPTLQKQLEGILPSFLNYGDSQLADLRATHQWIETLTWHLRMNNGNVNMNGDESVVYQQYAANLTTSLLSGTSSLQGSEVPATSLVCIGERPLSVLHFSLTSDLVDYYIRRCLQLGRGAGHPPGLTRPLHPGSA